MRPGTKACSAWWWNKPTSDIAKGPSVPGRPFPFPPGSAQPADHPVGPPCRMGWAGCAGKDRGAVSDHSIDTTAIVFAPAVKDRGAVSDHSRTKGMCSFKIAVKDRGAVSDHSSRRRTTRKGAAVKDRGAVS